LKATPEDIFDVASSKNNLNTMKKVRYQNHLRRLFVENQDEELNDNKADHSKQIKLVHTDWSVKIMEPRSKFLPDFETMKKPGFGRICKLKFKDLKSEFN
jgi:hypothetical protein